VGQENCFFFMCHRSTEEWKLPALQFPDQVGSCQFTVPRNYVSKSSGFLRRSKAWAGQWLSNLNLNATGVTKWFGKTRETFLRKYDTAEGELGVAR
jgi:hypothetical protein